MTVQELAKRLAVHIGQGRAHYPVTVFQWEHEAQPLTDLVVREGTDTLEFYSGTLEFHSGTPVSYEQFCQATVQELGAVFGTPLAELSRDYRAALNDDFDDLI